MRFLADDCLHVDIVAALRRADTSGDRAILLTADKDFGEIAIARGAATCGFVLFRQSITNPAGAAARLLALIEEHGDSLRQLYAVATPARARVRRLAAPDAVCLELSLRGRRRPRSGLPRASEEAVALPQGSTARLR